MAEYIVQFDIFNREESSEKVARFRTEKFRVYSDNDLYAIKEACKHLKAYISEDEYIEGTRITRVFDYQESRLLAPADLDWLIKD